MDEQAQSVSKDNSENNDEVSSVPLSSPPVAAVAVSVKEEAGSDGKEDSEAAATSLSPASSNTDQEFYEENTALYNELVKSEEVISPPQVFLDCWLEELNRHLGL